MKHAPLLASALLPLVVACGAPANPAPVAPLPPPKPVATVTAPESRAPLFVEIVGIPKGWVQKFVPTPSADLQAWTDAPKESFQHVLIKGSELASKKKAQAILDRAKKGEDFMKLVRDNGEDPGGGEYAAEQVENFVKPVKDAYAKLKLGDVTPTLVESNFGFHVVKKAKPSEEVVAKAYKIAKAPDFQKKLALDMAQRLHGAVTMRAVIADSVQAVLGESAVADERRPKPIVIEREQLQHTRLPPAAKAALVRFADGAHSGDVLDDPAADANDLFVARVVGEAG